MRSLVPVNLVQMGMGFILLIGGVGCATTSDLEKLNQGLDKQEKSLSAVEEEVRNLRAEIGGDRSLQHPLNRPVRDRRGHRPTQW